MKWKKQLRTIGEVLLILLGFIQLIGWVFGIPSLTGIGFMSNASPLPLVFSVFRGKEPFSSTFDLAIKESDGKLHQIRISPEIYAQLEGPYNLRNVYGAAFASLPMLESSNEKELVHSVLKFGFCEPGVVRKQFGFTAPIASFQITQTSRAKGIEGTWKEEILCQP
jgi:hypothetical protein